MMRGKNFRLFVISTIMTHIDTVIRIEPPRKEAAPSSAYLAETPSTKASALIHCIYSKCNSKGKRFASRVKSI